MLRLRPLLLAALALGALALPAAAQVPGGDPVEAVFVNKTTALLRVGGAVPAPDVDGRLDDAAWAQAPALADFVQREPEAGKPSRYATVARVAIGDDALYVGIEARDDEPGKIVGRLTRRDELSSSDWLAVIVDSDHDRRTAFMFLVNPSEVKVDGIAANGQDDDLRWDAVWDAEAGITAEGWVAELRIPLSMLRFSPGQSAWGIQVGRIVQRAGETSFWSPTPANDPNFVTHFGALTGVAGLSAPRRLEVLPYALAKVEREPGEDGDPFYEANDGTVSGGLDLKYGLTSNLTLDATLNPDFGQVEADPSEVNLTAFESFFEERRPFFVEGSEIFRMGLGTGDGNDETLFYSRRIGRTPQVAADGDYVDAPEQVSILGAAKLSGRTSGGWSIGVLEAVTAEEEARIEDAAGERSDVVVEPLTNYTVARLRKDFRGGATQVGALGTGVQRRLEGSLLEDRLRSSAYAGGVDVHHRFRNDTWRASAKLLGSRVEGSEAAILATQRSSARYFQRTDAEHVEVDSTRTSLSGWSGVAEIAKESGGAWRWSAFVQARSPGFEVNDLGFMRETDARGVGGWLGWRLLQPAKVVRRANLNFNVHTFDDFGGLNVARGGNVNGWTQYHNFWEAWAGVVRNVDNFRTDATRGGPTLFEPGAWEGWVGGTSDTRKPFTVGFELGWRAEDGTDGRRVGLDVWSDWQMTERTSLHVAPFFQKRTDDWQYVATAADAGGVPHYVFATIDQRTFALTLRVNHTFTPRLSLQFYGQPFVSAGDYPRFREVATPRAEDFGTRFAELEARTLEDGEWRADLDGDGAGDIAFDRPDFNVREFRSNLVARWEYRPGSTMFFVWSQARDGFVDDPRFRLGDDLGDLFAEEARNVFLVKVNGWLNL